MPLSVCLLTRNAEASIEKAIRSVAHLGAEVVLGDTGSTDRTITLARNLGAKVFDIAWQDDFGDAQNQTLDHATGDWVLWLNPDEELVDVSHERLDAMLARPEALAYVLRVHEVRDPNQPTRITELLRPRLFRRLPDLRYLGRLHPTFATPLEEVARHRHMAIHAVDIVVRHHAYLSVVTPDKLRWAVRLLELELKDRPGQLHYLIEYGRNLLWLNDPRGHEILAQAADQVLAHAQAPHAPTPTVGALLEYLLTVSPEQSRSRVSVSEARRLANAWFPHSPPQLWALAQLAFQAADYREAAGLLEKLILLGRSGTYDRSAAFDPSIIGDAAFVNLGTCHVRLGDLDRAENCFGQMLNSPTHQAQARQGYALVRDLRARKSAPPAS